MPTHLSNRYRIARLKRDAAKLAIEQPTSASPRKFGPGVVDMLVENLAKVNVQQLDGSVTEEIGEYIEPMQMQVVCYDLWERMPPDKLTIEAEDIGNIGGALKRYYENSVRAVAAGNDAVERAIREWFQDKLIAGDGVRDQGRQEPDQSGGADNRLGSKPPQ